MICRLEFTTSFGYHSISFGKEIVLVQQIIQPRISMSPGHQVLEKHWISHCYLKYWIPLVPHVARQQWRRLKWPYDFRFLRSIFIKFSQHFFYYLYWYLSILLSFKLMFHVSSYNYALSLSLSLSTAEPHCVHTMRVCLLQTPFMHVSHFLSLLGRLLFFIL